MAIPWCCPVGKTFLTGRLFSQPDLEENSMARRWGVKLRGIKRKIVHPKTFFILDLAAQYFSSVRLILGDSANQQGTKFSFKFH